MTADKRMLTKYSPFKTIFFSVLWFLLASLLSTNVFLLFAYLSLVVQEISTAVIIALYGKCSRRYCDIFFFFNSMLCIAYQIRYHQILMFANVLIVLLAFSIFIVEYDTIRKLFVKDEQ